MALAIGLLGRVVELRPKVGIGVVVGQAPHVEGGGDGVVRCGQARPHDGTQHEELEIYKIRNYF